MEVVIKKISDEELKKIGIDNWLPWSCEPSTFDWEYNDKESCYFYKGKVKIHVDNKVYEINAGDFVIFPKGLKCKWEVIEKVEKVYKFGD